MPSPPYKLTAAAPATNISVSFPSAWIFIDNPTSSPIYVRLGGTDTPTVSSADLIVPASSTEVVPTTARDFAFIFEDPLVIGLGSIYVSATIMVGNVGEIAPSFGTIQQIRSSILNERTAYQQIAINASMTITHPTIPTSFPLQNPILASVPLGRPVGMFENFISLVHWVHFHAHVQIADAANAVWVGLALDAVCLTTFPDGTTVNSTNPVVQTFINTGAITNPIDLVLPASYLQRQVPDVALNIHGGYFQIRLAGNPIPVGSTAQVNFFASGLVSQAP